MMGKQHRQFAIPFGLLTAFSLMGILGFGLEYIFIVPLSWYFGVFPDIDAKSSPRDTKFLKSLWTVALVLVPVGAITALLYCLIQITKGVNPSTLSQPLGISIGIILVSVLLMLTKKHNYTKFLWAHRGFTHTLILPVGLILLFLQVQKLNIDPIAIKILSVSIMGLFSGIASHIFLDMTCKAGVPILFPFTKKMIHIGNAITSDPRVQGKAHPSSIITTYIWSAVCLVLCGLILYKYPVILTQLATLFKK